jgi:hypothetical protein
MLTVLGRQADCSSNRQSFTLLAVLERTREMLKLKEARLAFDKERTHGRELHRGG